MSAGTEPSRIDLLRQALKQGPDQPFVRYALALELVNAGETGEAWQQFEHLLAHHPDYSATYFQAGKLLAGFGRTDQARRVLTQGIEVTRRQGQQHAESELAAALAELNEE
jgi:tetratricopeptide (TPR) repeat protein